jgi:excinuclease ABC subunit C
MDIKKEIKDLPDSPGVYLMKDSGNRIIYVGKAGSLRKRVASYFTRSARSPRTDLLVSKVKNVEYIPTASEAEALIYEANLIKVHKPRYNVDLKDDKSYPYLKLTLNEEYPRLLITRKVEPDGSVYYGPYTDAKLLRQAVSYMRTVFPLRVCRKMGRKLCMNYHVSKCLGPCAGKIDKRSYKRIVDQLVMFLEGKRQRLLKELSRRMEKASGSLDFEEAARIRNRITSLSTVVTKRAVPGPMDQIEELKYILGLKRRPKRIESFDISDIAGKEAVGSMVSFYDGRPDKDNYRKFRIKTVAGIDDYKMMREIVGRRYARLLEEKKGLPDLIIIDGGRGHLSTAVRELSSLGISDIPVIGIAKEFEHIYVPRKQLPIILPRDSSILQLIRRIRDEAHRFSKKYHTRLRGKLVSASELDNIKGIGKVRKKRLLEHFGSVDRIRYAGKEELTKVKGIDEKAAGSIVRYFKEKRV